MIRKAFIIGILLALILYLLWGFVADALLYDPITEIQRTAESEKITETAPQGTFEHVWGREILRNNLFSEMRQGQKKKAPPAPVQAAKIVQPQPEPVIPPPPRPNVVLDGIIKDHDGVFTVLLSIDDEQATPMHKGDSVEGLHVKDIQERSVTLIWNEGDEFTLTMQTAKTINR